MSRPEKAEFKFDESSLVPIEQLKAQGIEFDELVVKKSDGTEKIICIPKIVP